MSGIFFASTGGSLMNRARPLWPATEMATVSPTDVVPREERLERLADQLRRLGLGLGENLGVLDVVERLDDEPLWFFLMWTARQRLKSALTNIDAPNGATLGHIRDLCSVRLKARRSVQVRRDCSRQSRA